MSQGKQLSRSALQNEDGHCLQEQGTCTHSLVSPIQLALDPPKFLTFTLLREKVGKQLACFNIHVSASPSQEGLGASGHSLHPLPLYPSNSFFKTQLHPANTLNSTHGVCVNITNSTHSCTILQLGIRVHSWGACGLP